MQQSNAPCTATHGALSTWNHVSDLRGFSHGPPRTMFVSAAEQAHADGRIVEGSNGIHFPLKTFVVETAEVLWVRVITSFHSEPPLEDDCAFGSWMNGWCWQRCNTRTVTDRVELKRRQQEIWTETVHSFVTSVDWETLLTSHRISGTKPNGDLTCFLSCPPEGGTCKHTS